MRQVCPANPGCSHRNKKAALVLALLEPRPGIAPPQLSPPGASMAAQSGVSSGPHRSHPLAKPGVTSLPCSPTDLLSRGAGLGEAGLLQGQVATNHLNLMHSGVALLQCGPQGGGGN